MHAADRMATGKLKEGIEGFLGGAGQAGKNAARQAHGRVGNPHTLAT